MASSTHSLIPLVNQIHHHLHHHVLFLGATLGNHQREGHEGVVRQALGAIGTVEDAVVVQEPKEQGSGNALVAIAERVVLGDDWSRRKRSFTA